MNFICISILRKVVELGTIKMTNVYDIKTEVDCADPNDYSEFSLGRNYLIENAIPSLSTNGPANSIKVKTENVLNSYEEYLLDESPSLDNDIEYLKDRTMKHGLEDENIDNKANVKKFKSPPKKNQCYKCDFKANKKVELRLHEEAHSKNYCCVECLFRCTSQTKLNKHIKANHGGVCFICDVCKFNSTDIDVFAHHKKNVHGIKVNKANVTRFPIPPKPVLMMDRKQVNEWFPSFFSSLSKEMKMTGLSPLPDWVKDVSEVISLETLAGLQAEWQNKSGEFYWKLKLFAAILLDHKGFEYNSFGIQVDRVHDKYSVKDLKIMSKAKNPATFESLFT